MSAEQDAFRPSEPLVDIAKKLRGCLGAGACAPLVAAKSVIDLADHWDQHEEEAGCGCSQWLRKVCGGGRDLSWWRKRQRAVERIGEASRRTIDHSVAVYVSGNVPDEHMVEVKKMLFHGTRTNGGNPYTLKQAVTRIHEIVGHKPKPKACPECRRLRQLLLTNGIDPKQ